MLEKIKSTIISAVIMTLFAVFMVGGFALGEKYLGNSEYFVLRLLWR